MKPDIWRIALHDVLHRDVCALSKARGFGFRGSDPLERIAPPLVRRVAEEILRDDGFAWHDDIHLDGRTNELLGLIEERAQAVGNRGRNRGMNLCVAFLSGHMRAGDRQLNGGSRERALQFLRINEEAGE